MLHFPNCHSYKVLVLFFSVYTFVLPVIAQAKNPEKSNSKPLDSLVLLAEEAINAQNIVLVSGNINASLEKSSRSYLYKSALKSQFLALQERYNGLKKVGQDYKSYETTISLTNSSFTNQDKATLHLKERTKLMLGVIGGPKYTEYIEDHSITFSRVKGEWYLIKDELIKPVPVLPANIKDDKFPLKNLTPLRHAPKGLNFSGKNDSQTIFDSKLYSFNLIPPVKFGFASSSSPTFAIMMFGSYDRYASVTYARQYAISPNPIYETFRNDCTNFVSQCVNKEGWSMVGLANRANNNNWYYYCSILNPTNGRMVPYASYSWGAAYNFNQFVSNSQRADPIAYYENLDSGDIIFADWDNLAGIHSPDGRVDHTMIVTAKDTSGNTYVSYHSNYRLDRPMYDIAIAEPSARFYGFRLRNAY